MAITRGQMKRQLYGVGSLVGREKFGIGSRLKKFVRKIIPNEIAEVAVKAAPFVAPFNPLLAGGMSALGSFDQTGSIGRSVKSGLINYGLGQGARYLGGAQLQGGINPFAGDKMFTSPIGMERTGLGTFLRDKGFMGQPTPGTISEGSYLPFQGEEMKIPTYAEQLAEKSVKETSPFKQSVSKLLSGDFTTMGEGLKELGGKGLKAVFTKPVPGSPGETQIDKLAIGATIAGAANYLEARKLAKEADLVTDEDEYTEDMYEADKARYDQYYAEILKPEYFGLKDGGRVQYAGGGLSKNRVQQLIDLLDSTTIDEDYRKQIMEEIDKLMGKYKSGGRVKYQSGSVPGGVPSIKLKEEMIIPKPKSGAFMTEEELEATMPGLARGELGDPLPGRSESAAKLDELIKMYDNFRTAASGMANPEEARELFNSRIKEDYDSLHFLDKEKFEDYIRENKSRGGRMGYAYGSDREGIMTLEDKLNVDTIYKDDDRPKILDELGIDEDLMARFPTSVFSKEEINRLFKDSSMTTNEDRKLLYRILMNPGQFPEAENQMKQLLGKPIDEMKKGGRVGYAMGSEVPVRKNQGGVMELDYRNTGGFVPIGVKEKADDVPAMLSKNEFVFTADAVRAAGGGSVNKGAQKMYNLMKSLENKVV
tara:strand:+ start:34 stop:1983 length:1950 start_codon:yes stop_codon:yes gene_type:complete